MSSSRNSIAEFRRLQNNHTFFKKKYKSFFETFASLCKIFKKNSQPYWLGGIIISYDCLYLQSFTFVEYTGEYLVAYIPVSVVADGESVGSYAVPFVVEEVRQRGFSFWFKDMLFEESLYGTTRKVVRVETQVYIGTFFVDLLLLW